MSERAKLSSNATTTIRRNEVGRTIVFPPDLLNYEDTSLRRAPRPPVSCAI
jgi:hypothetical protein